MKKDTEDIRKERLPESVEQLTEENQRHFLGILQALAFAQHEQGKAEARRNIELLEREGARHDL